MSILSNLHEPELRILQRLDLGGEGRRPGAHVGASRDSDDPRQGHLVVLGVVDLGFFPYKLS